VLSKDDVTRLIKEVGKRDFTLCTVYKEFLKKVKIFQKQSNEKSFKYLIEEEIQDTCKASPSVANSMYTKFAEGFSECFEKAGNVKADSHIPCRSAKALDCVFPI
jgi:hypothetical protein